MKRMISCMLFFILVFSAVTGCKRVEDEIEISPWYDGQRYVLDTMKDVEGYDIDMCEIACISDNGVMTRTYGTLKPEILNEYDSDPNWEFDNYLVNAIWFEYFSFTGEKISSINIRDLHEEGNDWGYIYYSFFSDDGFHVFYEEYSSWPSVTREVTYNPETWEIVSERELVPPSDLPVGYRFEYTRYFGDIRVEHYSRPSNLCAVRVYFYRGDELLGIVDSTETHPGISTYSINTQKLDDDSFLLFYYTSDEETKYEVLNINTFDVTELPGEEVDMLFAGVISFEYFDGVGLVSVEEDGLKIIDINSQTKSVFFDYNNTFENMLEGVGGSEFAFEDGKIIRASNFSTFDGLEDREYCFINVLTGTDEDPRSTRREIKAASLLGFGFEYCAAVSEFNKSNDEYYITLDSSYDINRQSADGVFLGRMDEEVMNIEATMSDQMAVDLMAGDGPDLIFNSYNYDRLSTSSCLMDLSSILDEISGDEYFCNILEASRNEDGSIYQLPLGFYIYGIVSPENIYDGTGFTLDEYNNFVNESDNGKDPVRFNRNQYFAFLFNSMSDLFISDGRLDISGDYFRDMADYVNENIPENGRYRDERLFPWDTEFYIVPHLENSLTFGDLLSENGAATPEYRILGLPSCDGRGAMGDVSDSVAVASGTDVYEGCIQFIRFLMNYEYQSNISYRTIPIRRDVFEEDMDSVIRTYNDRIEGYLEGYTLNELQMMGISYEYAPTSGYDYFIDAVNNCNHLYSEDSAISIIMIEEMPAYFEGQKSLDDVIEIIEDRANTYLSERE